MPQNSLQMIGKIPLLVGRIVPRGSGYDTGAPGEAVYPSRPVRVEPDAASHSLLDLEQRAVERALRDAGGNRRRAAEMLGISERTLYRRIKQFRLED